MGLLSGLPLAPLRGVGWVLEQVVREANRQYADPAPIHRETPTWNWSASRCAPCSPRSKALSKESRKES
ncbi:gas vesicle protein GvpG [Streptomyces sp. NPDC000878]